MGKVLVICIVSVVAMTVLVLIDRYRLEGLRHELDELRLSAELRSADSHAILTKELP
jgi:hypothetical protein